MQKRAKRGQKRVSAIPCLYEGFQKVDLLVDFLEHILSCGTLLLFLQKCQPLQLALLHHQVATLDLADEELLLALLLLLLPQVIYITCAQAPCPACIPLHLPQWQQARHAKSYWDLSFHRYWRCWQIIALHFELQLSRTSN